MNHKSSVFNFLNLDPFPLGSQTSSVIQGFFLNLSMVLGRLEALAIYCFTLASPMSLSRMYGISPGSHGTSHVSCSSFLTSNIWFVNCEKKKFSALSVFYSTKTLSYIEALHVLSELSKLLELSELIEHPDDFSSIKKHLLLWALRPGDPLCKSWLHCHIVTP